MPSRRRKQTANATPVYDPMIVKQYARDRWAGILAVLGGVDAEYLDGNHHPCPKCGGRDRFRFSDRDGDGSMLCNQCFRPGSGDGLSSLEWLRGCKFGEAVRLVAEHLGVPATRGGSRSNGRVSNSSRNEQTDITKYLESQPWNESIAAMWCVSKPSIKPSSIQMIGGGIARYRKRWTVIDLPVIGVDEEMVGHCVFNAAGGDLPIYVKDQTSKRKYKTEWRKVKLVHGSQPGLIGTVGRLAKAKTVWLVEGPTDVLALLSADGTPDDVAVITHSNGCGPLLDGWMLDQLRDKTVYVIGDADCPGQEGAENRANQLVDIAADCRVVALPFEIAETHGKDLRDYFYDQSQR